MLLQFQDSIDLSVDLASSDYGGLGVNTLQLNDV